MTALPPLFEARSSRADAMRPAETEASTSSIGELKGNGGISGFAEDLKRALGDVPHAISPKYFYDAPGSALFDRICELPEYYPTRTEVALLTRHAAEMAELAGARAEIVEFGAGSLHKVRILLDAFDAPCAYLPIDISGEHLNSAARRLQMDYSGLDVSPVVADYTQRLLLPAPAEGSGRRIGFFPGSTIGNFLPHEARSFLRLAARALQGGALVLGADLVKAPALLHAAYNDSQRVTASFNLNLLARANRELGTAFKLGCWEHYAFYNAPYQRIEMHLVNLEQQSIVLGEERYPWPAGQSLQTEYSHKFTVGGLKQMAIEAGFEPRRAWVDQEGLFSVHWLEAPKRRA